MPRRRPAGRGVDTTGRSKKDARHVRLYHSVMRTAAYRSLSPQARALLIELYALFNGENNGELFMSLRDAATRANFSKNSAKRYFDELQETGFIRLRAREPIKWSARHARCWILTEHPFGGQPPSRDFDKWRPPGKTESVSPNWDKLSQMRDTDSPDCRKVVTIRPKRGTVSRKNAPQNVPRLGHR